jgi:phosphatidylserine/phosphatidylglycerophosphate/cardiolipin synthase-like enzyme/membrane protein DedA with SNARE-associated domain
MRSVLEQGRNCWRLVHADRVAFVVDGDNYFRAVREALCKARRSIFIIGWDIHSEIRLVRNGKQDDYPEKLGPLLDRLARERHELDIYILDWDFAMIYAMEREFFPHYKLQWKSHDRVHFCLDGNHPVGASQHQKIVVVDNKLAFSGGFDLSKWRWDTSEHTVDNDQRVDPDGKPYPPFHDVQMLVDGEAAAALGELARERWRIAAGNDPDVLQTGADSDPWPASCDAALERINIAIARTLPAYNGREEVREVECLYLDCIEAAQTFIYIENQYLTSQPIGRALASRLQESGGPQVVIVMPEKTGGWLEQHTMDVLRARLLQELRAADKHDRLRVYYVRLAKDPHVSLMVHAKVMIIDDCFARVGSSNISNRSMGLDSECDIAVESSDAQNCNEAIAGFRRRLLAEHLGVAEDDVVAAEEQHALLIDAIESLRVGERTLEPLSGDIPQDVDQWIPESELLDPEKPVEPDEFLDYIVTPDHRKPAYRYIFRISLLVIAVLGMAAMWRWTPLSDWLDIDRAETAANWIRDSRFTPVLVLIVYAIGGLAAVPVTLMIIATVSVFGPWVGAGYALIGTEIAALLAFGVGHVIGRDTVSRIAGSRVNRLSRKLSERGVLTIITLRIVPVAPFTVINIIAGISEIRLRDFAIGSFIGMVPGVMAISLLADRIIASLRNPSVESILVLVAVIALVVISLAGLRYWIHRKRDRKNE